MSHKYNTNNRGTEISITEHHVNAMILINLFSYLTKLPIKQLILLWHIGLKKK